MPEGNKRAGPLVIVLKQQAMGPSPLKDWSSNQLVTTLHQPAAALIAAAQMKAECNFRKPPHQGIVHFNALPEPAVESPTLLLIEGPGPAVKQRRVMRRIDLNVCGSQSY